MGAIRTIWNARECLREPIPEIEIAADRLEAAVRAHMQGNRAIAEELLRLADDKAIRNWLDSVWGKATVYNRPRRTLAQFPILSEEKRAKPREATAETRRLIHKRDGHYCRFCKIPVIRKEVRLAFCREYPSVVPWGRTNVTQHAAFQCMWAQYDHILPHARGGQSNAGNMVLSCAACNFGRGTHLLEEFDLLHPNLHPRRYGCWDGLESFLTATPRFSRTIVRVAAGAPAL